MTEAYRGPMLHNGLPRIDGVTVTGEPVVGSVQVLYPVSYEGMVEPGLVARASDGGSVFDIGTIFEIPESGAARNTLRHRTFTEMANPQTWQDMTTEDFATCFSDPAQVERLLSSPTLARFRSVGAPTHHVGIIDRTTGQVVTEPTDVWSDLVLVRKFPVIKPGRAALLGTLAYDYHDYTRADSKVIALEHIVRLGNPGGSSLQDRYDKLMATGDTAGARSFLAHYGAQPPLQPWSRLPNLAFDWTTKYEPRDRPLSLQETLHVSGVPAEVLHQVVEMLSLGTVYANKYFAQLGLELWDMKWEVAVDNGRVVIADTLDHDSIRVTSIVEYEPGKRCHVHFNKQAVRDYLRIFHADWHAALEDAKRQSAREDNDKTFLEIYHQGVTDGTYPPTPQIDPAFTELQRLKYELVTNAGNLRQGPAGTAQDIGQAEVVYYRGQGQLDAFLRRNATGQS